MTELDKLILHLQNLVKSNKTTVTLDAKFLLEIVSALPKDVVKTQETANMLIDVDGGDFHESTDR
jgi:hypothetical protein